MSDSGETRIGRSEADEALVGLLASGTSIRSAADALKLSERTIYRRLRSPTFRRRLNEVKSAMTDGAVAVIAANLSKASAALVALLGSDSELVRLQAAKAMHDIHRNHHAADLERRLVEVEDLLAGGGDGGDARPDQEG